MILIMALRLLLGIFAAATLAAALAACGSDSDDDETQLVATTGIVAELAERVAGADAEVVQLVPDGASPHDFELSAQDRQTLEEADLIVYNGAGLEAGIPIEETDAPRWALAENAGELLPFEEGGEDPHVWMDPTRTAAALDSLAAAMGEADPANSDGFEQRAGEYAGELRDLDSTIREILATIPRDGRSLVTSHDSLGYFADRYDLEVVATPFPASGPEAEASPARLSEVIDAITEHDVPTVFAQEDDDPEVLRQIAEQAGVAIFEDLRVESPGDARSYRRMLRSDALAITTGLTPTD
jgi:zinc/manganese transport system substrate-binding protein